MPTPKKGESKNDFMSRCIPQLKDEGRKQDQAIAICSSMWERAGKDKKKDKKDKHEK